MLSLLLLIFSVAYTASNKLSIFNKKEYEIYQMNWSQLIEILFILNANDVNTYIFIFPI